MRTSDAERQRAADFLRDACADGRLTTYELEERLDRLFSGATVGDIAVLVRDLPGGHAVVPRHRRAGGGAVPVPVRRPRSSPARPLAALALIGGVVALLIASLPPLMAILLAAIALSLAVAVGVMAIALAPVALALAGLAWLVQRVLRGRGFGPPASPHRPRHPGGHPFL